MMTKEQLTNCRDLWKWLAGNPNKRKSDWPEWVYNGGQINEVDSECFACEAALSEFGWKVCIRCDLIPLWGDGERCFSQGSPFREWASADYPELRAKYARIIWQHCDKLLKQRIKEGIYK